MKTLISRGGQESRLPLPLGSMGHRRKQTGSFLKGQRTFPEQLAEVDRALRDALETRGGHP